MSQMTVSVRFFGVLAERADTPQHDWVIDTDATPPQLRDALRDRFGDEFFADLAHCTTWVNGAAADDAVPLRDGDEVAVMPPFAGG